MPVRSPAVGTFFVKKSTERWHRILHRSLLIFRQKRRTLYQKSIIFIALRLWYVRPCIWRKPKITRAIIT